MNKKIRPDAVVSAGIIWLAVLMIIRIGMVHVIGENGIAMASAALELFLCFAGIWLFGYAAATSSMVRTRLKREQLHNADQGVRLAMRYAFLAALVLTLIATPLLIFLGNRIVQPRKSAPVVLMAFICLLFMSVQGVMHGFLEGGGRLRSVVRQILVQSILGLALSWVFAGIGYRYGLYVNALLKVTDCAPAYGAFGCMLGLCFSLIITLFMASASYKRRRDKLLDEMQYGAPKFMDKSSGTISEMKYYVMFFVCMAAVVLMDERFFFHFASHRGEVDVLENWGIYFGCFLPVSFLLALVCALPFVKTCFKICAFLQRGDSLSASEQFGDLIHFHVLLLLPVTIFAFVLAEPLMTAIFFLPKDNAIAYMNIGFLTIVVASLAVTSEVILVRLKRLRVLLLNLLLSCAAHMLMVLIGDVFMGGSMSAYIWAMVVMYLVFDLLSLLELSRVFRYRQEYMRSVILPAGSSLVSGLVVLLLRMLLIDIVGEVVTLVLSVAVGAIFYLVLLTALHGLNEYELYEIPGGSFIARIARQIHIL